MTHPLPIDYLSLAIASHYMILSHAKPWIIFSLLNLRVGKMLYVASLTLGGLGHAPQEIVLTSGVIWGLTNKTTEYQKN